MADYGQFKIGNVSFPLPAIADPAKIVCDPALTATLNYFKAVLDIHLLSYWTAIFNNIGMIDIKDKIVTESITYDPALYMQESQYKFPLLSLFRTTEEYIEKTVHWYAIKSEWHFNFIMPPVTAAQMNTVAHIFKVIRSIILDRTEQGYDPNYLNGKEIFGDCGIAKIAITDGEFGHIINPKNDLNFPYLKLVFEVEEREQKNPGLDQLEGLDGYVKLSDEEASELVDLIEFEKDLT